MTTTITLSPAPISGGTLQPTLSESVWLGAQRFLMIYTQITPNTTFAAVIDLQSDPFTTGGNPQTVTTNVVLGSILPLERPLLVRLDYNRVLMIYSQTKKAQDYTGNTVGTRSSDPNFDAMVIEIGSDNSVNVVYAGTNVIPASFMNSIYKDSAPYPTLAKGSVSTYQFGSVNVVSNVASNSSFLWLEPNHLLVAVRDVYLSGSQGAPGSQGSASLYEVFYASGALTVSKRIALPTITYGGLGGLFSGYATPFGPDDYPFVSQIPGTTSVVFGWINYDLSNGATVNGSDPYVGLASSNNFLNGSIAYVVDYTQPTSTWVQTVSISYRKLSMLCPLDNDRMLEVTSQQCASGTAMYARIFTLSSNSFSPTFATDFSAVNQNSNGALAFGLINQITNLGNDHVILSMTNRTTKTPYYGIFRLVGTNLLQCTQYGVPALAPITFQRGFDAIIPRVVNDPNVSGNSLSYDFFARLGTLSYTFLRYANPA